ncbi:MAG: STY4851/ECs_5259 family protein, partial [Candidatus Competibacteraceae bacterium]|nr:STY4851/ECs_5259 family protein [Candidatus Competibacteraceae bacterium]
MNWLTHFVFTHTRQTPPDGRPLYAYKINDKIYDELKNHFHQIILLDMQGGLATNFAQIFCLYAAETFRREHAGGNWTWETIFKPVKMEAPSQSLIADWVEKGLKWWRRPVLHANNGHRLLLMTIACEGGLPLRLLQQENAHLTQFFRTLLESYYRSGQGGESIAESMARQQAYRLPRSLRQDVVFHLSATLIVKISELQALVGNAVDPIAALDEKAPNWRRDLPLRLDDQVAETLLTGLVHRSRELAQEATAKLCWQRRLYQVSNGWHVERRLELPERLTGEHLAGWIDSPVTDRPRWRLLRHTPDGIETVAWLTLVQGAGKAAQYRREWLRSNGLMITGAAVGQEQRLSLHDGQRDYPLDVKHGEPWGDSPWVFVERDVSGEREWLTEGSTRTRAERAWILAAPEFAPRVVNGACDSVGIIPDLDRTIYQISGEVDFFTSDQDYCRVTCQAESESQESFIVIGDVMPQFTQSRPLYRGLPQIETVDADGRCKPATGHIQRRPVGNNAPWRPSYETAHGRIWLRLVDVNGAERCRRQVDVAPRNFRVEIDIGTGYQSGVIRLMGLTGAKVQIDTDRPMDISMTLTEDQARMVCPTLPGSLPPPLSLSLHWPGSEWVTLILPYPQRGAFFEQAGRPLLNDDWISLDRLGSLQLFVQDPGGGRRFWLKCELITRDQTVEGFRQRFHDRLPPLEQGRLEIPLFAWQERIASLLASNRDLEAQVRLIIETTQGERLASLRVTRFDAVLEPDRTTGVVQISVPVLARLGAGWEARIRLEMIRLWAPARPPVELSANPETPICWKIPSDLEPGPWWIVGRDGDWTRFRPLLWVAVADDALVEGSDDSLAGTIREADPTQRGQKLNALLAELGRNPDHPDWSLLFEYMRLAREFPPSSLDVLCALPAYPRTLALALFKADDETFDSVWSLSRQMPFLWILLAVDDWQEAAVASFSGLQAALAE